MSGKKIIGGLEDAVARAQAKGAGDLPKGTACDAAAALAEAWASMDGKLEAYHSDRTMTPADAGYTGHFDGYNIEAAELIVRLQARGFTVVAIAKAEQSS